MRNLNRKFIISLICGFCLYPVIAWSEIDHWYETQPSCVTDRGNPARTGEYDAETIEKKPKVLWVSAGSAMRTSLTCYKNSVITGYVSAVNIKNGNIFWYTKDVWELAPYAGGTTFYKGKIYASVNEGLNDLTFFVVINPDNGELLFKPPAEKGDNTSLYSPLVYNNIIYLSLVHSIIAYDLQTKKILWKFPITQQSSPISTDGKRVYFSDWGDAIYALDIKTGKVIWTHPNMGLSTNAISLYEHKAFLYFEGTVYALETASGKILWKRMLVKEDSSTSVTVSGQQLFVNAFQGKALYSLDVNTGKVFWKLRIKPDGNPVIVKNIVYILSGRNLYAIDKREGKVKWRIEIPYNNDGSPADAEHIILPYQDKLFVINNHRDLIALQNFNVQPR